MCYRMTTAVAASGLKGSTKLVALVFAEHVHEKNEYVSWIGLERVMHEAQVSRNTARKAIRELERIGFLKRTGLKDPIWGSIRRHVVASKLPRRKPFERKPSGGQFKYDRDDFDPETGAFSPEGREYEGRPIKEPPTQYVYSEYEKHPESDGNDD